MNSGSLSASPAGSGSVTPSRVNVDGSVRDEDVFVLGDEDGNEDDPESDDDDGQSVQRHEERPSASVASSEVTRPRTPDYSGSITSSQSTKSHGNSVASSETAAEREVQTELGQPPKYFIRPDDTLLGISLRLGIDVRQCIHRLAGPISNSLTNRAAFYVA